LKREGFGAEKGGIWCLVGRDLVLSREGSGVKQGGIWCCPIYALFWGELNVYREGFGAMALKLGLYGPDLPAKKGGIWCPEGTV
jgi:hypothetical protein